MPKRTLTALLLLCLLLPAAAGLAERYENWYDLYTGVMEGDDDAVYTGGDRIIGPTEFKVSKERTVHISADPPVTIQGTVVIWGGNFTFTGIDLVSAPGELRREPLEVVGSPSTGIPRVFFHGNLSSLSKSANPRWGFTCANAFLHVTGDVSGGKDPSHHGVVMGYNAQIKIVGKIRTLVDGQESTEVEAGWFWLRSQDDQPDGRHPEVLETWLKHFDPETGEETVYRPETVDVESD